MKTLLLAKDLLMPPDARQSSVTQSQKESWLRLMERERSSQFASIASAASGKTENLSPPCTARAQQGNQRVFVNEMPKGTHEVVGPPAASLFREGLSSTSRGGYGLLDRGGNAALLPSCVPSALDGGKQEAALEGVSAGAGLPLLERQLRQRWPRVNVLVVKDSDGVRIWLRDPDLLKNESTIDSLVAQIKKELAGQGVSLAALTVNGEAVFCNQEG